jgi:photosystem II stability/assembly factor-like uncharacterized protein
MASPYLLSTRDAGETWHVVSRLPFRYGAWLNFVDRLRGFAVAGHTLYATTDGGRTWREDLRPRGRSFELWRPTTFGRRIVVPDLAFARGGNPDGPDRLIVYSSRDGGVAWTSHTVPKLIAGALDHDQGPPTIGFTALTPDDWIAQSGPTVLVTTNAGRTWRTVRPVGLPPAFRAGTGFTSLHDGWALIEGKAPAYRVVLVRTTDGGRHWVSAGPRLPRRHR